MLFRSPDVGFPARTTVREFDLFSPKIDKKIEAEVCILQLCHVHDQIPLQLLRLPRLDGEIIIPTFPSICRVLPTFQAFASKEGEDVISRYDMTACKEA